MLFPLGMYVKETAIRQHTKREPPRVEIYSNYLEKNEGTVLRRYGIKKDGKKS